jgi:hypothetical protein
MQMAANSKWIRVINFWLLNKSKQNNKSFALTPNNNANNNSSHTTIIVK